MRVIFLGASKFSEEMLKNLLENGISIEAVFSIPQNFEIKKRTAEASEKYVNANYSDIQRLATENNIPCYVVSGGEENLMKYQQIIADIDPDLILVLGWYYIVPKKIRNYAKLGTFGIHASMLPAYAGGSPLVWAIINGEKKTGITMFKIEDGIDDGDIVAQDEIRIDHEDTIKTLYDKVADTAKIMLVREIQNLANGTAKFVVQDKSKIVPLPIRTPEDGLIDWNDSNEDIYNFIRAQTKPYPCAFSFFEGVKVKFVAAKMNDLKISDEVENGSIIHRQDKFFIKTGKFAIEPLEIEVNNSLQSFANYFKTKNIFSSTFKDK